MEHSALPAPQWLMALLLSDSGPSCNIKKVPPEFRPCEKLFLFDLILLTAAIARRGFSLADLHHGGYRRSGSVNYDRQHAPQKWRPPHVCHVIREPKRREPHDAVMMMTRRRVRIEQVAGDNGAPRVTASDTGQDPLKDIDPGTGATFLMTARVYAAPDAETRLTIRLAYRQASRSVGEEKSASLILTPRQGALEGTLTLPDVLIPETDVPFSLTLRNATDAALPTIIVPLTLHPLMITGSGSRALARSRRASGPFRSFRHTRPRPCLRRFDSAPRRDVTHCRDHPAISLFGWNGPGHRDSPSSVGRRPVSSYGCRLAGRDSCGFSGDRIPLTVEMTNSGTTLYKSQPLYIILCRTRLLTRLPSAKPAHIEDGVLTIRGGDVQELTALAPGESVRIAPLFPSPAPRLGALISRSPSHRDTAFPPAAPDIPYSKTVSTRPLRDRHGANLTPSIRYFSPEGDQLGRGPLPPRVGKVTKYWATMQIKILRVK